MCLCVCVSDATGDKELLQNIPEIQDKFNILSKIGEGQFTCTALCSYHVQEEDCLPPPSHVTWVRSYLHALVLHYTCTYNCTPYPIMGKQK